MILEIEKEYQKDLGFEIKETAERVIDYAFSKFDIPYEISLTLLLVDNDEIQRINAEYRDIDKPTDVLSFPSIAYEQPGVLPDVSINRQDFFDPENGSLYMGDIMVSLDKVASQAEEYGHSTLREFAFLLTHSVLHLMGYDHMEAEEEKCMFDKQREILEELEIRA